uniref:Putative long d7 salivary protein n=1 Tax=Psorophora albipes TaxID=869069 RepID=T1E269_9DIPT
MYLQVVFFAAVALFSTITAWEPLDPEKALFIYTRCMEDHLPNDSSRKGTLAGWRLWDLIPTDKEATKCYARCVLTKTGLYDPGSKKFNAEVIRQQWNAYQDLADENSVNKYVEAVQGLPKTEDSCEQVFNAYNDVHTQHKSTARNVFHGNPVLTKPIYAKLGDNIRQPNQSYFLFCENLLYPIGSSDRNQLCKIRLYFIPKDELFKKHADCFFKGLRYLTEDNELDRSEIKRDFEQVNKDINQVDAVLDACGEPKKNSEKAFHYYKCLVESSIVDDFKEAFDYREIRSQNYGYNLAEKKQYNRQDVVSKVSELDNQQCPP